MTAQMSPELRRELEKWLSNPSPVHGLCAAIEDATEDGELEEELADLLHSSGLSGNFPFNSSPGEYFMEQATKTCHMNPKRLAWVKSKLGVQNESKT